MNSADAPIVDLVEHRLKVTSQASSSGATVWTVSGDTHAARHALRESGGRWDPIQRVWLFEGPDPRPGLALRLARSPTASGLSDLGSVEPIAERPHYWGHRQRLRDRLIDGEDGALADYELVELLLFFAIPKIDTKPLAKRLIERFGSLAGVIHATPEQLAEFEPLNHFAVALFKAVRSLACRIAREEVIDRPAFENWDKLIAYLRTTMAHQSVEQFRLLFLDRRNVLIADEVQNKGTIDHTPVYPREVVRRALTLDASALVMAHNHPSNHPQPSKPDIEMTRQVREIRSVLCCTIT